MEMETVKMIFDFKTYLNIDMRHRLANHMKICKSVCLLSYSQTGGRTYTLTQRSSTELRGLPQNEIQKSLQSYQLYMQW